MSDKTHIEWTDATWNPVTGCSKVSAGCKHCYAERDWARLSANHHTRYFGRAFTDVQCHPDVLELPLRWRRPRRIFVNSMADLFHDAVPDQFIADVFAYMAFARHHSFQVLTKRPERMARLLTDQDWIDGAFSESLAIAGDDACDILGRRGEFDANRRRRDDVRALDQSLPLANVWLGVSVEDQAAANERIPLLLKTPAAVRWISAEPLLGPLVLDGSGGHVEALAGWWRHVDWVVAGGESGPNARPMHPTWARSLRDQCAAASVPMLFKQWGEWLPRTDAFRQNLLIGGGVAHHTFGDVAMARVGKKAAGRLLDGVQHDGYPETAA